MDSVTDIIKIEDANSRMFSDSDGVMDGSHLVIDTRGPSERRRSSNHTTIVSANHSVTSGQQGQHHSADAIEGLQALAEQAGLIDSLEGETEETEIDGKTGSDTLIYTSQVRGTVDF